MVEDHLTAEAVLLVGFGGPETMDQVAAFVASVLAPRRPPPHVVDEVAARYRAIGGGSPLPETTRRQAKLLEEELSRRQLTRPVAVGMLHARPTIDEAIENLVAAGAGEITVISLAPYRCEVSTDAYEAAVRQVVLAKAAGLDLRFSPDWNLQPRFIGGMAEMLGEVLGRCPRGTPVIFSAHSLPRRMIDQGDPYALQLLATAAAVATTAGASEWHFAYQSVSQAAVEPWLGPPVEEVIDGLHARGHRAVVVDPIGFVADHLETLYDCDLEQRAHAEGLGMQFHRCLCLNEHLGLIGALADIAIG